MRRRNAVMGIVLLLAMRAATIEAQSTGGSFGGSRGFGGGGSGSSSDPPSGSGSSSGAGWSGSSSGAGWSGSSSGAGGSGSSSGAGWSGSSSGSSTQESDLEARRREEEALRRAEQERLERERLERERLERERLERERLERELALPPAERAKSDRFRWAFAFGARRSALAPEPGPRRWEGGMLSWWGGYAPEAVISRTYRWKRGTLALSGLALLAIVAAAIVRLRTIWRPLPPPVLPKATVRVLSVGIDWTRRREVQQRLSAQSGARDLSTAAGMFSAWDDVRTLLRESLSAVRYVSLTQTEPLVADAQRAFDARANDLRERYIIETVRDATTGVAPSLSARSEEGEGLVVVSVVAGFNRALAAMSPTAPLDAVIEALCGDDPEVLVALQTVWSPTHDEDRMSSAELEARYPELRRLDDGVGRVQCASCKAVWARELGRCPACGAPPV